jgi:hypothetical protein
MTQSQSVISKKKSNVVDVGAVHTSHSAGSENMENDIKPTHILIEEGSGGDIPVSDLRDPVIVVRKYAGYQEAMAYLKYLKDNPEEYHGKIFFLGTVKNSGTVADKGLCPAIYQESKSSFGIIWKNLSDLREYYEDILIAKRLTHQHWNDLE